jgi:hypothetical protein
MPIITISTTAPQYHFLRKVLIKGRQSPIINKMTSISYWENSVFDTTRENLNIHKMKIELLNSMLAQL